MKLIRCFLLTDFTKKLNSYTLDKFDYEINNVQITVYVRIGFPEDSIFECNSNRNIEIDQNYDIVEHNVNEIIKLALEDNADFTDITGKIIDKFNKNNLFIYTYSEIENNNISDILNIAYLTSSINDTNNKIDEINLDNINNIGNLIFNINNDLYKLGKKIKLYNLDKLKYITLGENEMSLELQKKNEHFEYSITLKDLINRIIGVSSIDSLLKRYYITNSKPPGDICYCEYDYTCFKCNCEERASKYEKCIKFLNKISKI